MYEEMKVWISEPKCRFDMNGDDQGIHNYLFYHNKPFATAMANRAGSIVNTVGFEVPSLSTAQGRRSGQGLEGGDAMEALRWREGEQLDRSRVQLDE
jgi:hypothetical protein